MRHTPFSVSGAPHPRYGGNISLTYKLVIPILAPVKSNALSNPEEMKDMYVTVLAQGKKYGIKMPVYEGCQMYVSDYFRKIK